MAKIAANSVLMDFTDKSVRKIAHQIVPSPAIKSLVLVQAMVKVTSYLLSYLIFIITHSLSKYLTLYKSID